MKLPWVSRRKFEKALADLLATEAALEVMASRFYELDDQVDFWRDTAGTIYEREQKLKKRWQADVKALTQGLEMWRKQWLREYKKNKGIEETQEAEASRVGDNTGTSEGSRPGTRFVPKVRTASSVLESHSVDTGRLDGKAAPGGATPGRG